jgi:hypothetical protein
MQRLGRIAPREREVVSEIIATSLRAKRSNPFFLFAAAMDCFAALTTQQTELSLAV